MTKRFGLLFGLLAGFVLSGAHIGYLFPAGGERGTTIEILVGGQRFWAIRDGVVSGKGVTIEAVEIVPGFPQPAGNQRTYFANRLKAMETGAPIPAMPENTEGWVKNDWYDKLETLTPQQLELVLRFLYIPRNPLQMSPAISSNLILRVRIAPDAEPGERELRLTGNGIVTNPARFIVGTVPEVREPYYRRPPAERETPQFTLPAVLNGQILPGEADDWRFRAEEGESVTFTVTARQLLPFIGDAVPGHFQTLLEVRGEDGRLLAFNDDHGNNPDSRLIFTAPRKGEYTLTLRDALYRGREDFVYRIDAAKGRVEEPATPFPTGPAVRFAGVLHTPDEVVRVPFEAEKGERLILEVFARRLNSPIDSLLQIYDETGERVAFNDDHRGELLAGTMLQPFDSKLDFTAPETGTYTAAVSSLNGETGRLALLIDRPRPRFIAYLSPSGLEAQVGGNEAATLHIERIDGFNGEIRLKLDAPDGYQLSGSPVIPPGTLRTPITIAGKANAAKPKTARLFAIGDNGFETEVIPADLVMQAFAWYHLVPAQSFYLARRWKYSGGEQFAWEKSITEMTLRKTEDGGYAATLSVTFKRLGTNPEVELLLSEPPAGLTVEPGEAEKNRYTFRLKSVTPFTACRQLFRVQYRYDSKPDKEGKVKRIASEVPLPVLLLTAH